jgi:imidazole glycerol phosphate synthase subunit HisF
LERVGDIVAAALDEDGMKLGDDDDDDDDDTSAVVAIVKLPVPVAAGPGFMRCRYSITRTFGQRR